MIHIYGDSHANSSFKNLQLPFVDHHQSNITMFRIGRDHTIVNYNNTDHDENSIICLVYGEIDCRCHIHKQINIGKEEEEIIHDLVEQYFSTIKNQITLFKKIIIVAAIPPTKRSDYETKHGPITHEYPFMGTDEERVRYTRKLNQLVEHMCKENQYIYFDPYATYTRDDGTLRFEYSDNTVHLGDTAAFLKEFMEVYQSIKDSL